MLVHCRVTPSIKFASTHLYTWVERGTVRVKCLAQEHNTMSLARAQTQTARSGVKHTNHEATVPRMDITEKWYVMNQCYMSQLVCTLSLVNLAGCTLLYGPLKLKVVFVTKMSCQLSPSVLNFHSEYKSLKLSFTHKCAEN